MGAINAYIGFNGKCREAMTFYQSCLGGELDLREVAGSPMAQHWPSAPEGAIYHSMLTSGGMIVMGSDMSGPDGHHPGNSFSLAISCDTEAQTYEVFEKLSAGGKVMDPLKEQFWGAIFGALEDKFGIRWMFNFYKQQQ